MPIYYHSDDGLVHITSTSLRIGSNPMFSGSGGGNSGPPKPPKAPVRKPAKKKK